MQKFGKFIVKYRKVIIVIALLLLIPSVIGIKATKINYDILVYLPNDVETVKGQHILSEDFNMGAFSVAVIDHMENKDVIKLEERMRQVPNVEKVIGITDVTGSSIPTQMLPDELKNKVYKDGTTAIMITFKTEISADETLKAIDELRSLASDQCKISGMSATIKDTMEVSDSEMAMYVIIAVVFCLLVLMLALDSYFVPVLLLGSIGIAILYNMGSNVILGNISFITKAIATVLQLGVTMDFSIFLYHSYQRKKQENSNIYTAMEQAIADTLVSVVGSSITTIAGFLALCTMTLALGKDIGLVMAKGVLLGVISVVTILPALILIFDKWITKTKHKQWLPKFTTLKNFNIKHNRAILIIFAILLIPAIYGNAHTKVYYNIYSTLPDTLQGTIANKELKEKFNMASTEVLLIDKEMSNEKMNEMLNKIDQIDGVEWTLGTSKILNAAIPKEMIPEDLLTVFQNDQYQMIIINSKYESASNEANTQIEQIGEMVKQYDQNAITAGEAPLMKDLVEIADHDFNSVNITSVAIILFIMAIVFHSISLPVILVAVIEFAIALNMSVACYTNTTLPFIASIVIGTIQLGATVDYAILMTTQYVEMRKQGKKKREAIDIALGNSMNSIIVSALCFFAATCGVAMFSKLEMIGSICNLISRGAIISMVVVITVLPACLLVCDKLICNTTRGMRKLKKGETKNEK